MTSWSLHSEGEHLESLDANSISSRVDLVTIPKH